MTIDPSKDERKRGGQGGSLESEKNVIYLKINRRLSLDDGLSDY